MPIRVEYQPVESIGAAAFMAGLGQYQQRQQEMLLRQQAQQQQADLAQQQLAAHLYSQQQAQLANQASQAFHAQQQWDLRGADYDADMQKLASQQQFTGGQNQAQRDQHSADLDANRKSQAAIQAARNEEANSRRLWDYSTASANDEHKSIDGYLSDIGKQLPQMSDVGRSRYADLATKFQAISRFNDSGMMRPQQYLQAMGQFRQELSKANLESHITPPTDAKEEFEKRVHTDPSTGNQYILQPDGNIRPVPAKPDKSPDQDYAKFVDSFVGKAKKVVGADGLENSTDYTADDIKKLWDTRQKALGMISGKGSGEQQQSPTEADFGQTIQAIIQQSVQAALGQQPVQQQPPAVSDNLSQEPDPELPPPPPMPSHRQVPEPTMKPERGRSTPAIAVSQLNPVERAAAIEHLPRPASRAALDALPVGVEFIAPDGTIWRKK